MLTGGCDTIIIRAIDNRPMSLRSQALFHSITEVEPCLAAALHPIQHIRSTRFHPHCRTLGGGKFRLCGWPGWHRHGNGNVSTRNFSNLMIGCSPTWVCRGRPSKRCADPRYTWLRGATADSNLDAFPAAAAPARASPVSISFARRRDAPCPLSAAAANGHGCNEANCGGDKTTSLRSLYP
jgi:hypothetical protein